MTLFYSIYQTVRLHLGTPCSGFDFKFLISDLFFLIGNGLLAVDALACDFAHVLQRGDPYNRGRVCNGHKTRTIVARIKP